MQAVATTKYSFIVPALPPSYTASLKINHSTRTTYLSQQARKFKDIVAIHMPYWELPKGEVLFIMHNRYHANWYYKNGKIKKKDVQNMNRLLIDAVFKKLGLDDCHLWMCIDTKVQSDDKEEFTEVTLEIMDI